MKKLILSLTSLIAFASSPSLAFISAQEEGQLLQAMNQINPAQVQFESIRCSLRNRMCLVKALVGPQAQKVGCMIERISDASELYVESLESATGKTFVSLSPYAHASLSSCLSQLR